MRNSENTLKVFYHCWRILQKYLIVFGECAKSILAHTEIAAILVRFEMYKVVSEYAKSILACMENTLSEDKRIWRMRLEYFAVYA